MKNKKILFIYVLLFIALILVILLNSYFNNKKIRRAIQEDQRAVNNELVLYKINKMEGIGVSGVYLVDIINDKEELIRYIVKIEKGKVVYCEEAE